MNHVDEAKHLRVDNYMPCHPNSCGHKYAVGQCRPTVADQLDALQPVSIPSGIIQYLFGKSYVFCSGYSCIDVCIQ